jgi:epi-isozizaene synthase
VPVVLHEIPSPSQAKEVELEDDRNRDVNPLQRLAYLYDTAWIPHASMSTITHETDLWVEAHRLTETAKCRERYQLIDCGMCASYFYRYAREIIVRSASDIIAWLFIFDDYFGEGEQIGSRVDLQDYCYSFKSVIEGADSCALSGSFHRGLADFCSRMAAVFGSGWRTAFWESFEAYFTGCLAEYDYRRQGLVPTYDEYRRYRKNSIGVLPIFEIIDAPSSFLDPEIRRDPVFRALREQAAILCSQCNDIASYEKECRDGDPNNIIKVVQSHFGLTEEGAIERCVAIHAQDLKLFDDLVAKIMAGPDYEPIRRYAKGLRDLVTGCYAFHQRSRRYKRESFHLIRLPQVEIDGVKEAIASVRERSEF